MNHVRLEFLGIFTQQEKNSFANLIANKSNDGVLPSLMPIEKIQVDRIFSENKLKLKFFHLDGIEEYHYINLWFYGLSDENQRVLPSKSIFINDWLIMNLYTTLIIIINFLYLLNNKIFKNKYLTI